MISLELAAALKAGETIPGAKMSDVANMPMVLRVTAY